MIRCIRLGIWAAVLVASLVGSSLAAEYIFSPVSFPGADSTVARGINSRGVVVGWYTAGTGPGAVSEGFILSGQFKNLRVPGARSTFANGINNKDLVVGSYFTQEFEHLGFLHRMGAAMKAKNRNATADPPYNTIEVDFSTGVMMTAPYGINDDGEIVGEYVDNPDASEQHGFLFNDDYINFEIPGALATAAQGINDAGVIVGWYWDNLTGFHGFLKRPNEPVTTLDYPGIAGETLAYGINNKNEVVGYYVDIGGKIRGFVYKNGVYSPFDVPGATNTFAFGINDKGAIVGRRDSGSGVTFLMQGFVATPVVNVASKGRK